ncbi:MAG: VacJ family lipoprotein [Chromatiales bacterium]|nr:VacJ family lipoprotein [Chromatiales bacterium]
MSASLSPINVPLVLLIPLALLLSGCSYIPFVDDGQREPDPWESMNRSVNTFNNGLDDYLLKPLAKGYQTITPEPVDKGVSNFFSNLDDVTVVINDLLQFKVIQGTSDLARLSINSTVGILGLFDVADRIGIEKHHEDFGQTLGFWGAPNGPYLVLPFFGPSTLRDGTSMIAVDWRTDPLFYEKDRTVKYGLYTMDVIDTRADLLYASNIVDKSSTDSYLFIRESYLQRRRNLVYDGKPPEDESMNEFLDL